MRPPIGWLASAPLGIAIVLEGAEPMFGAYDEGRLTERLTDRAPDRDDRPPDFEQRPASVGIDARRKPISELVSYDRWGESKQK